MFPVGVIAIGIVPMGLLSLACGASLGVVNFTCGLGVGAWVRCAGLALGGDAKAAGLALPPAGEREDADSALWYWARVVLVALGVLAVLGYFGKERLALSRMTRVVDAEWTARPETAEGLYIAPDSECRVQAQLRSDGESQLHATILVRCGGLELVQRQVRSGCDLRQRASDSGHVYDLACEAARVAEHSDEDSHTPEQPGLSLNTIGAPGRVRVHANGPPPMNVVLTVDSPSLPVEGEPLLLDRRTELDEE